MNAFHFAKFKGIQTMAGISLDDDKNVRVNLKNKAVAKARGASEGTMHFK